MILEDVQRLTTSNLITLYELDCTGIGGSVERYHNHTDGIITWQGEEYYPWAIEAKDFARTGEGQQPLPELTVGNIGINQNGDPISGVVTALCLAFDDLVGATLIRKRTFAKYLDAVNFDGGNPAADPNEHLPDERWIVSQKKAETPEAVVFVLASPLSFENVQLPSRQIMSNVCAWLTMDGPEGGYRGSYCSYQGQNGMFTKDGEPTNDPTKDQCSGTISACKLRFGENNPLPYGSFPSADRTK